MLKGEEDLRFSLNAISRFPLSLAEFRLVIEEPKLNYLYSQKKDNMQRAGLLDLTLEELQHNIEQKIASNYNFNLCLMPAHQIVKFNIMLEFRTGKGKLPMKYLLALEYMVKEKAIRLITMY